MSILVITNQTRIAIVDDNGVVLGSNAGEILTYDDAELRRELDHYAPATLSIYQLPEWPGMTDAEMFHLPRSVEALLAHGAVLRRTIKL